MIQVCQSTTIDLCLRTTTVGFLTSYSGTRRYVDLGAVAEAVAKPRGDIAIESHDNGDFSVVISNVSDQNGVLGVSVSIWSEKNGQDDIIWYNATRLNNGNYQG